MKLQILGVDIYIFLLLIYFEIDTEAQNSRLVYKVNESTMNHFSVLLKWYSQKIINNEGVNLYRLDIPGGMKKCNNSPILPLLENSDDLQYVDSSFRLFAELIKLKPELLEEGFLQLHLFIQSFQSNQIARVLGIFYTDSNLQPGRKYLYIVKKIISDKEIFLAHSDTIAIPADYLNNRIHSFTCSQVKNKVEIKWQPMDSLFFSVNIYRKDIRSGNFYRRNSEPVMISYFQDKDGNFRLPDIFFRDTFNTYCKDYIYTLKGIDFFGEESFSSDTLLIHMGDNIPPRIVKDIKLSVKDSVIILTWKSPDDKDLKGFNIYRSFKFDSLFQKVNSEILPSSQNQFYNIVPEPGSWYYKVSSLDSSGNESFSENLYIETHDLCPPKAPSGLKLVADSGKIIIQWRKNREADIKGYLIYRLMVDNSSAKPLLINSFPIIDTIYVDRNISCLNEISYQIAAIDNSSNISRFSDLVKIKLSDKYPPVRPYFCGISTNHSSIILGWLPNPEVDLAFYEINRFSDNAKPLKFSLTGRINSFCDTSIVAGEYYEYELLAIDSAKNYSPPSVRAGIKAVSGATRKKCSSEKVVAKYIKSEVKLHWRLSKEADLIGYSVFRKDSSDRFSIISNVLKQNEFTDKAVMKGNLYQYEIRSYYSDGNVCISDILHLSVPNK